MFERLDALSDLGVAAIWLSPVHPGPPGDFGYAVSDYDQVRPEYGSRDDLRRLVQQAHARDIRVLLDVVPNHTSHLHPWFRDAEARGPISPWWDWYDRDADGAVTHYFNWTHLPNLNFNNADVRRSISSSLLGWVRDCDVDGFRIDVAWGIKQRCPEFWPEFAADFRALKSDGLLIAEASARDPWYCGIGFDAAYDWTDALGTWAWDGLFDDEASVANAISTALAASDPGTRVFRFLNNNDTGARFVTRHGIDCYQVALGMLLTLPGIPCLYIGDEVGAEFEPYGTSKLIDWSDHQQLRPHIRKLVRLRRELPGLASMGWTPLPQTASTSLFAYLRYRDDGSEPVVVLLNFSGTTVEANIDPTTLREALRTAPSRLPGYGERAMPDSLLRSGGWIDRYNDDTLFTHSGPVAMPVPAWGMRILVPEPVT